MRARTVMKLRGEVVWNTHHRVRNIPNATDSSRGPCSSIHTTKPQPPEVVGQAQGRGHPLARNAKGSSTPVTLFFRPPWPSSCARYTQTTKSRHRPGHRSPRTATHRHAHPGSARAARVVPRSPPLRQRLRAPPPRYSLLPRPRSSPASSSLAPLSVHE